MLRLGTWMLLAVTVGGAAAGCSSRQSTASGSPSTVSTDVTPATDPVAKPLAKKPDDRKTEAFEYPAAKVKLKYPADWKKKKNESAEDVLTVSPKPDDAAATELTVSVPKLPFHIKGMIPLGAVKSGYYDDLKKRMTGVKEDECPDAKIAGASGVRRFIAEGKDKTLGDRKLDVLLITKGDTLYVITAEAPTAEFETAHSTMECVLSSLEWMN